MTAPSRDAPDVEPFEEENTDGAAAFERATRAARALADIPPPPSDSFFPFGSAPAPLQIVRVGVLLAAVGATWLAFMLWEKHLG